MALMGHRICGVMVDIICCSIVEVLCNTISPFINVIITYTSKVASDHNIAFTTHLDKRGLIHSKSH